MRVSFANTVTAIDENTMVGTGIKVADVVLTDDAIGSAALTLSGADAAFFELRGSALYFIGASPDFESKASYAVTVEADDPTVGGAIDAQATFTLGINDMNEAPTALSFANTVTADRREHGGRRRHQGRRRGGERRCARQRDAEPFRRGFRVLRAARKCALLHSREPGLRGEGELRGDRRGRRPDGRRRDRRPGDFCAQRHRRERGTDRAVVCQHGDGDRRERDGRNRYQGRRRGGDRRRTRQQDTDLVGSGFRFLRIARQRTLLHRREPGLRNEGELRRHGRSRRPDGRRSDRHPGDLHARHQRPVRERAAGDHRRDQRDGAARRVVPDPARRHHQWRLRAGIEQLAAGSPRLDLRGHGVPARLQPARRRRRALLPVLGGLDRDPDGLDGRGCPLQARFLAAQFRHPVQIQRLHCQLEWDRRRQLHRRAGRLRRTLGQAQLRAGRHRRTDDPDILGKQPERLGPRRRVAHPGRHHRDTRDGDHLRYHHVHRCRHRGYAHDCVGHAARHELCRCVQRDARSGRQLDRRPARDCALELQRVGCGARLPRGAAVGGSESTG